MGLRTKFNLALIVVSALGLGITGFVAHQRLQQNAREEVIRNADIMMEAAAAVSDYTVKKFTPYLELQLQRAFLPQAVGPLVATEMFNAIRAKYPEYTYQEKALNPTNPRNRAVDWEADVVHDFRGNRSKTKVIEERATPNGPALYLARPIQIRDRGCLTCHSTPDKAPSTMLALYGSTNGFGWELHEIIGAQIVTVQLSSQIKNAQETFKTFMGSLVGIFVAIFAILNIMMHFIIIHPLARMASVADAISTGDLTLQELPAEGNDEVATLAQAFNRLRRSVEKALKMIEE
ncbi:MAG: DUF3365 domain-containing protein [Candidatus Tectimicrobiota bacterium]